MHCAHELCLLLCSTKLSCLYQKDGIPSALEKQLNNTEFFDHEVTQAVSVIGSPKFKRPQER